MGKKKKGQKGGGGGTEVEDKISKMSISSTLPEEIQGLRTRLIMDAASALDVLKEGRNSTLLCPVLDGLMEYQDCFAVISLLGRLVLSYDVAKRFAEAYLCRHGSPLSKFQVVSYSESTGILEPLSKKPRGLTIVQAIVQNGDNMVVEQEFVENVLKSVLVIMKQVPAHVYASWDVNHFFKFESLDFNEEIRWYTAQCLSLLFHMTETEKGELEKRFRLSPTTCLHMEVNHQVEIDTICNCYPIVLQDSNSPGGSQTEDRIHHVDEISDLVAVDGFIVKQACRTEQLGFEDVVMFPLIMERIKDISLHIISSTPVCVIGPIGCGKSTALRQVFSIFGRDKYPEVINVQVNDQMDSRVILGSYHSTDLPGQFVWKPGCLTKAILNGHWILFEDIDAAPMDVITLLDGFMNSKSISVPGYGEIDYIHTDFRMFATCRQLGRNRSPSLARIGHLWKKVFFDNYTMDDLKLIVHSRYAHLRPIVDVLVKLYSSVGAMLKELKAGNARILSTRDFLRFCHRIPKDMDFSAASTAISIFQNGLDLFVASIMDSGVKEVAAETVGMHLNLLKAKVEYFLTMYSPSVSICSRTSALICGRFNLCIDKPSAPHLKRHDFNVYSLTRRTCNTLEAIAGYIMNKEPVLLVGETGVGKTSCVQHLANVLNRKLVVVNLNRQSDSVDLLGGYKPVELKYIFLPIREEFESLFGETFNKESNVKYLNHIMTCYTNKRWKDFVKLMRHVEKSAIERSRMQQPEIMDKWISLFRKISRIETQMLEAESPFAFSFIDGTLIKALKEGHWILLDEINLATSEMLQCLAGVLDEHSQIHLWEKGDEKPIERHQNFHLFAAMNPSTDVGKKDLPLGIRNRFSELYVAELADADELRVLVADYLKELCLSVAQVNSIVQFYLKMRKLAQTTLVDGLGKRPHYSLRTFCRGLRIASMNLFGSVLRSLYESFCLSFLTQLDFESHPVVEKLVAEHIYGKSNVKAATNQPIPQPSASGFVHIEGYWLPQGDQEIRIPENYILTSSIRRNLKDIARIVSAGKLPVLIQGATSVGKTSLIQYLAQCTGNRCYRINNHQHTDLQEYIGSYQSDSNGKLVFAEGVLVQAMRKGEWVILDELNLAPSEVLEALNRLLDDNRQLFITETGVTVTAHARFMLFATQNPPGLYGGRKILSRAFRNRFVELHFDEIPSFELENILHLRCAIPVSYCKKIIGVLNDLQVRRKASAALQGKHGFATLRDLFRWAERYRLSGEQKAKFYDWDQHLADEGYLVLAGKERKGFESNVIQEVLEKRFKRTIDPNNLFCLHDKTSPVTRNILELVLKSDLPEFKHIVWTLQMRRLVVLIGAAMKFKEPILLVGETGCGKTTIVQLLSQLLQRRLFCVNCHMNSEGSDFLGGLRPLRTRNAEDGRLFEWVDGPLVEAMESGGIFLADEISLADDSVLERLNSVLEPERSLLIAEKGEENPRLVTAHCDFHFIGTMNPGGDYGKKELSPALRNRLTEIWCDTTSNEDDLTAIIEHNLHEGIRGQGVAAILVSFMNWLHNNDLGRKCTVSVRDYLSWVTFINHLTNPSTAGKQVCLSSTIMHGACMTVLDGLGAGSTGGESSVFAREIRLNGLNHLKDLISKAIKVAFNETQFLEDTRVVVSSTFLACGPFSIDRNRSSSCDGRETKFSIDAPTTSVNTMRLLRALQLSKPILLEGSPGVGKTALVSALAKLAGYPLTRINLSEQTDISDLFGADLPVEGKEGGHFEWRDGPLLQALKTNSWILLDELNLASQSVLEGLNACLDHRGSVYVPELNRTFHISNSSLRSRIFGCQNPVRQGGARKGLPKSFLNRFIQVYVDSLSETDFAFVLQKTFANLPSPTVHLMSTFASRLHTSICHMGQFGVKGGPWDINLRDLMRWAELTVSEFNGFENSFNNITQDFHPENYVDVIYGLRMRTRKDRQKVLELFCQTVKDLFPLVDLNWKWLLWGNNDLLVLHNKIICGHSFLKRIASVDFNSKKLLTLRKDMAQLEALLTCLSAGWMPILVGYTGCGKTCLVNLVANLCGRKLHVMHPSPEMDTIELLGGFEQADIYRRVYDIQVQIVTLLRNFVKQMVLSNLQDEELLNLWSSMTSMPHLTPEEGLTQDEEMKRIWVRVNFLQAAYLKCKSFTDSESRNLVVFGSSRENTTDFYSMKEKEQDQLERISKELQKICTHLQAGIQNGAFQWIDSRLIKAMENGDWLLIDGANRCSAAVLDRLNSLMEPNGSIILSERGSIDGNILEIKPHPEFRLILTLDPTYGEISRAMRNRGVEIYMGSEMDPEENLKVSETNDLESTTTIGKVLSASSSLGKDVVIQGTNTLDLDDMLKTGGLYNPRFRNFLIQLHLMLDNELPHTSDSPDEFRFKVLASAKDIVHQLQLGISVKDASLRSLRNWYLSENEKFDYKSKVLESWKTLQKEIQVESLQWDSNNKFKLPLTLQSFVSSEMYRVWKHLELFEVGLNRIDLVLRSGYNSIWEKELVHDFLIVSVFSRVRKQDCGLFATILGQRYSDKAAFLGKMTWLLNSLEFSNTVDLTQHAWDLQELPAVIGKFLEKPQVVRIGHVFAVMKLSLLMHLQGQALCGDFETSWRKSTLGYALTNARFTETGPLLDFLKAFLSLALRYQDTFKSALKEIPADLPSQVSLNQLAQLWVNGIKASLWTKRLQDLLAQPCPSSVPEERVLANMHLIVQWISQSVLPLFHDLQSEAAFHTLQQLVDDCILKASNCRDETQLMLNKKFRDQCDLVQLSRISRADKIDVVMRVINNIWSLEDAVPKQGLLHFFLSHKCQRPFDTLVNMFTKILESGDLTEENRDLCISVYSDIKELNSFDNNPDVVSLNLFALKEIMELRDPSTELSNSGFAHPLYVVCNSAKIYNPIVHYLAWEHVERLRHLFQLPVVDVRNSNLIPLFVGNILIVREKLSYRIPNLEMSGVVQSCHKELVAILSKMICTPSKQNRMNLMKQAENFQCTMQRWECIGLSNERFQSQGLFQRSKVVIKGILDEALLTKTSTVDASIKLGTVMVEASSFMMEVASYFPAVDPVVEKEILVVYLNQQVTIMDSWMQSKRLHHFARKGCDFFEEPCDSRLIHPYVPAVIENIITGKRQARESVEGIIPRPKPPAYAQIISDIQQFVESFATASKVQDFCMSILMLQGSDEDLISSAIVHCENWLDCYRNFVQKIAKHFWYWDITAPFLEASVHAASGYQLICDNLRRHANRTVPRHSLNLVKFPLPFNEGTLAAPGLYEDKWAQEKANKQIMLSSLQTFSNKLRVQQRVTKDNVVQLQKHCVKFCTWWKTQEEEKLRKKEEEDAFYVFKGRERQMGKSDEQQEEEDISNLFPSFDSEFKDLQDVRELADSSVVSTPIPTSSRCGVLMPEDVMILIELISSASSFLSTHWLSKTPVPEEANYILPLVERFEIGCTGLLGGKNIAFVNPEEESEFACSANVVTNYLTSDRLATKWDSSTYNFYYDSNISEVQKLQTVLSSLRKRTNELLTEWPDHPALQQIINIITRIESFHIDGPIMKFLTGLELLLATCQEWEVVASRHVSIALHLEDITRLIISWRKLELRFWKNLLDYTLKKYHAESKTWWFHLYSVIMEVSNTNDSANRFRQLMQKFMESSTIGEFEVRLTLLHTLHRYITLLKSQKLLIINEDIQSVLWNVLCYYSTFSQQIIDQLHALRSPIEQKMKDFIKVSRWNDSNFYALVDSVKKSQKTLNKLIVEFKKVLKTPVSPFLVADVQPGDVKALRYKIPQVDLRSYLAPESLMGPFNPTVEQMDSFSENPVRKKRFVRLPKVFRKSRTTCGSLLQRDREICKTETSELNELSATIIERVQTLQNQPIPDSGPQRKKALHNVHNLRRKNLADLFKTLQGLGLSYQRGFIKIQNIPENSKVPYDFLIPSIDIAAGWIIYCENQKKAGPESQIMKSWKSSDAYFQNSVARMSAMMQAFQSPSKELGGMISERCKGFAVELFSLIKDQRSWLERYNRSLWNMRLLLDVDNVQPASALSQTWTSQLHTKISELYFQLYQIEILVKSVTAESYQEDKQRSIDEISGAITKSSSLKTEIIRRLGNADNVFSGPVPPVILQKWVETIVDIKSKLDAVLASVPSGSTLFDKLAQVRDFANHCENHLQSCGECTTPSSSLRSVSRLRNFRIAANRTFVTMLLGWQELKGLDPSSQCTSNVQNSVSWKALEILHLEKVHNEFLKMRKFIGKRMVKEDCSNMIFVYNALKPLVKQYTLTSHFYLAQALEHHRETCKLTFVLTGIFTTLAQKGFCLPSDYQEEAAEEGREMDEKSGMGMGEGELTSDAKDVSERFESEDQLEDTLKQGESVPSADKDVKEDDKGVEMGEDFDGKQQSAGDKSGDKDDDSASENEDDQQLDKEMGDVSGDDEDVLDDKMWGGSSDEEDENEKDDSKEGKGVPENSNPELAPKDSEVEAVEPEDNSKEKKENPKDYSEMDEGEINDDQIDPYHGQNPAEEEPEPMDLPVDLKLDGENDDKDGEEQEANPFDLDEKETTDFPDLDIDEQDDQNVEEEGHKEMSEENDGEGIDIDAPELDQGPELDDAKEDQETQAEPNVKQTDMEEIEEEKPEDAVEGTNKQDTQSNAEQATDRAKDPDSNANQNESAASDNREPRMNAVEEEHALKENDKASGQVTSKDGSGQEGETANEEKAEVITSKDKEQASRKPGETNDNRTLSSNDARNRLKIIEDKDKTPLDEDKTSAENDESSDKAADLYQHIKDGKDHDTLTLDNATQEQMLQRQNMEVDQDSDHLPEMNENMEEDETSSDIEELQDGKMDSSPPQDSVQNLPKEKRKKTQTDNLELEQVEIPGEKILTHGAQRPMESTFHTQIHLLEGKSVQVIEGDGNQAPQPEKNFGDLSLMNEWNELERQTTPLAQELCEQLRLILEPTQASKLKGDYKTGKRLNMRKVIPYIASGFRKDKIWLRRTQPSKREYQILLALDDSASMCDNQSKQMAFSAVAVVARALSLLEVGHLGVISFGEDVRLLHPFEESFTDFTGARLLKQFTFAQRKTRIVQLMDTITALFSHARQTLGSTSAPIETAQLLLIVSDGRSVCHEGNDVVRNAVKRAMEQNVFIVFVIVDNPENQHSILDIQKPIFREGKSVEFIKYMDDFPFPFYLILRDLLTLPSVLSDALRQWFELVTSGNR